MKKRLQQKNVFGFVVLLIIVLLGVGYFATQTLSPSFFNDLSASIASSGSPLIGAVQSAADKINPNVYVLPAPTSDPVQNLKVLQAAANNPAYAVIDGIKPDGTKQTYSVMGTLNVNRNVLIRHLDLNQEDPGYTVRTILARPRVTGGTPISVSLSDISIRRGPVGAVGEMGGSRTDSAAIWFEHTVPTLNNIEVYGGGKGTAVEIALSKGGTISNLHIHDIVWQPYAVDKKHPSFYSAFSYAAIKPKYWVIPIHDYDSTTKTISSSLVNINEQANGLRLDIDNGMTVTNLVINNIGVRFNDNSVYPWQTDGLDIGSGSSNITVTGAKISNVWEGIDEAGTPSSAVVIKRTDVSDTHNFCYKIGHSSQDVTISNSTATRCGIAGFEVYGVQPGDSGFPSTSNIWLIKTSVVDAGIGPDGTTPWANPRETTIAAYRVEKGAIANPDGTYGPNGVHIVMSDVATPNSTVMQYAYYSDIAGSPKNVLSDDTINGSTNLGSLTTGLSVIPDDSSQNPSNAISWHDVSSLVAATIRCNIYLGVHEQLFSNSVDRGWTYGQLKSYLSGLKGSNLSAVCAPVVGGSSTSEDIP